MWGAIAATRVSKDRAAGSVQASQAYHDTCPIYPDASSARTHTQVCGPWCKYEQHVSGDIAFAVRQYYYATADTAWLRAVGWPLVKGVAAFYAARVEPSNQCECQCCQCKCFDYNQVRHQLPGCWHQLRSCGGALAPAAQLASRAVRGPPQ